MEKALRTHESDVHVMQLRESELKSQLRDRAGLEKRIEEMKEEITDFAKRLKAILPFFLIALVKLTLRRKLTLKLKRPKILSRSWTKNISRLRKNSIGG